MARPALILNVFRFLFMAMAGLVLVRLKDPVTPGRLSGRLQEWGDKDISPPLPFKKMRTNPVRLVFISILTD